MPYCTQQDMIDRLGKDELVELTDRSQLGEIDTAVLDAAIVDASSEIDLYLSMRYTLPLSNVPGVLTNLCCTIARFNLHDIGTPEHVQTKYDAAIKLLKSIADNQINLDVGETSGGAGNVLYEQDAKVFDESQDWP